MNPALPAPDFPFDLEVVSADGDCGHPFLIAAMMTASHEHFGRRLAESCRALRLPFALYRVPTVHRSISMSGSKDLRFTKPNFVRFLQHRHRRPVLYLDVDCVIVKPPGLIHDLERVDFAIFNWLAERHTEAYVRMDLKVEDGLQARLTRNRFYRFSHSIDPMSDTQLLCSGPVQWYNLTEPARRLLDRWQGVIERAPGCPDDKCLDYAFNNFADGPLTAAWLPKSYARYAWWIYERPVIDHPQFPDLGRHYAALDELDGRRRIDTGRLYTPLVQYVFPKHCLIDTERRLLYRLEDGAWRPEGGFNTPLWLTAAADA